MNPRAVWLIARGVLIEAVRRRGIYAIVVTACGLIVLVAGMDFFHLQGLTKFYREMALRIMSAATALTVIVLAARQLPREFELRTIYPLLARPIGRTTFLLGKLTGLLLAAAFCFGLFMIVYALGTRHIEGAIAWPLFLQYAYLQMVMMLVLAALGFLLSMLVHIDAAIVIGILLYVIGATFSMMIIILYDYASPAARIAYRVLNYAIPQLTLFDLTSKAVHAETWSPLSVSVMAQLTLYGLAFSAVYFALAALLFRRRPL